jgi:hypothetical protein
MTRIGSTASATDPVGALYEEPTTLLLDDTRDTAQAASLLSLIGQGCHRLSEIAARLENQLRLSLAHSNV